MIIIEHEFTEKLPLLHVVLDALKDEELPGVIFIHGFTSAKEHNLHYAYYLARRGFRVILPEAPLHGERAGRLTDSEFNFSFWEIVIQMIEELEIFSEDFVKRGLFAQERIGVAGTSMGGIITLGALTQYKWIKAAVSLMGSPAYLTFAKKQIDDFKKNNVTIPSTEEELHRLYDKLKKYDLSEQPDKLLERPLLFWHSESDDVVPYQPTFDFYTENKPAYANHPERMRFITDKTSGHKVSREGVIETVRFFEKFM